jgi:hypothetical protein
VAVLLKSGALTAGKDASGKTALDYAIETRNTIIQEMIKNAPPPETSIANKIINTLKPANAQPAPKAKDPQEFQISRVNAMNDVKVVNLQELLGVEQMPTLPTEDGPFLKRNKVIEEIIRTEYDFLHDLRLFLDQFVAPMGPRKVIPEDQIIAIFGNLEHVAKVSENFVKELSTIRLDNSVLVTIGQKFIDVVLFSSSPPFVVMAGFSTTCFSSFLKVPTWAAFEDYFINQQASLKLLSQYESYSVFQAYREVRQQPKNEK